MNKLQKENWQLMEKVEMLEVVDSALRREYRKIKEALEFIMSIVECIETKDLKKKVFLKKEERIRSPHRTNKRLIELEVFFIIFQ